MRFEIYVGNVLNEAASAETSPAVKKTRRGAGARRVPILCDAHLAYRVRPRIYTTKRYAFDAHTFACAAHYVRRATDNGLLTVAEALELLQAERGSE